MSSWDEEYEEWDDDEPEEKEDWYERNGGYPNADYLAAVTTGSFCYGCWTWPCRCPDKDDSSTPSSSGKTSPGSTNSKSGGWGFTEWLIAVAAVILVIFYSIILSGGTFLF